MALDTVAVAQATPGNAQPFAELGLKADEYARIKNLGLQHHINHDLCHLYFSLLELAAGDSEKGFFVTLCCLLYDLTW